MSDELIPAEIFEGYVVDPKSTDDGVRQPWDRLGDESSQHYALFCMYRDAGVNRTLADLAKATGLAVGTLRNLSSRNGWTRRADSYDDYLERQERRLIERGRMEARRKQINLAQLLQQKAIEGLKVMNPLTASAKELAVLADVGVKMERQARGEVESTKRLEITGDGGGAVEVAQTLSAGDRAMLLQAIQEQLVARQPVEIEAHEVIEGEIVE